MSRRLCSKAIIAVCAVAILTLGIAGCSGKGGGKSDTADQKAKASAAVVIDEQNHVTVTYSEAFDKEYYNAQELESMVDAELLEFSNLMGNSQAATKTAFEVKDSKAVLKVTFCDYKAYASYYQLDVDPKETAPLKFYVVSCNEAKSIKELKLNDEYTRVEDSKKMKIDSEELSQLSVVFINQGTEVSVPGDIAYVSGDVKVEDGIAKTADGKKNYIFYKSLPATEA